MEAKMPFSKVNLIRLTIKVLLLSLIMVLCINMIIVMLEKVGKVIQLSQVILDKLVI
jgi:hypothetical protein